MKATEGNKFDALGEKIRELQDAINQLEAADNPDKALLALNLLKFLIILGYGRNHNRLANEDIPQGTCPKVP